MRLKFQPQGEYEGPDEPIKTWLDECVGVLARETPAQIRLVYEED